jgi:hypothetical protein
MKNYFALIGLLILTSPALKADLVDWFLGEFDGRVYTDSSFTTFVGNGTVARFGTFGTGYDFSGKSFANLDTDFTPWDSTTINNGFFEGTNATTTGPFGTPWYFFLGSSAASFGVFGNPAWTNTLDPFVRQAELSLPTTFAAGGFGVVGTGPNAGSVALVPEPATGLLIGMGSVAFLLLRRRKKLS